MNIVVCVKRVPDPSEAKIDKKTNTIVREGVKNITNPFDTYAIEEAVRIKEAQGGKVTAISMGPPQNEESLKEAIAMGADEAVLISDRALAASDTWATSLALSAAIKKIGNVDMVFCGREAIDGDTGQVGPGIAEKMGIAHATYIKNIREVSEECLIVERMIEDGYQVVKVTLPALLTVVKDINEPRMPSLKGMMKAKKAKIPVWSIEDLGIPADIVGLDGSPTKVVSQFSPEIGRKGQVFEGDMKEQVSKLVEILTGDQIVQA